MSRREDVQNTIWDDDPFATLTPNAKLLYLWSFTNQKCNMAGLYRVRVETMTLETGLTKRTVADALDELRRAGMAFYERGILWVRARVKRLTSKSPTMARSIIRAVEELPPGDRLREGFLSEYGDVGWLVDNGLPERVDGGSGEGLETLCETRVPIRNPETVPGPSGEGPLTEPEQETEQEQPLPRISYAGKRVPPDTVKGAAHLLNKFNEATGRTLGSTSHLKQIAGAMLARPDTDLTAWERAIRNTVRNPPSFIAGAVQLGHVFGERAADHALANDGKPRNRDGTAPASAMVPDRSECIEDGCAERPLTGTVRCAEHRDALERRLTGVAA